MIYKNQKGFWKSKDKYLWREINNLKWPEKPWKTQLKKHSNKKNFLIRKRLKPINNF